MTTQNQSQTGKFVWHTLNTTDPGAARKFYTSLFGWRAEDRDMGANGKYTMFYAGDYDVGGMATLDPKAGAPSHWLAYVSVDNADAVADKARSLGAKILVPGMDIPNIGRFSVFADPQGGVISAFKGAPGAPMRKDDAPVGGFCFTELVSTDAKGSREFYTKLLGWKTIEHDMGGGAKYTIFADGDKHRAGLMQSPMPVPVSFWLPYVLVTDVAKTVEKARSLGAKIVVEPKKLPTLGELAVLSDPTGAHVAIWRTEQK